MTCKGVNSVGGQAVATSPRPGYVSPIQPAEIATGRFNCWLEKTSCDHHAVIAQASALMRAHQRVSEADHVLNRQAH
jgi:hypothetical protein